MRTQLKKSNGVEINMQNIHRHLLALLLLLFLSSTAYGEDYLTTHIIEISPGIGYYNFDENRNLDSSAMAVIGLGLHLSRRWAVLLQYSALDTTRNLNGVSQAAYMQKYHIDVHRFFNTEKKLRPYLVAGFGQMDLDDNSDDFSNATNKNMLNGGFGLYYRMTPSWSVRTDVRIFANTNNEHLDNALTLTLGYRFNGGERSNQGTSD